VLAYTFKRLIQGIITVWFIATATFFAMHAVPGDPLANERATTETIRKNLEARYGLDRPVTEQYLVFLGNMLRGDFGISFTQENRRVNDIIRESFPVSATLGILAVAFAAFGGVVWGALTAIYRNRLPDLVITFLVIVGISVPSFVVAALGQLALVDINAWLGFSLLPVAGWGSIRHMIVPSMVLGLGTMAGNHELRLHPDGTRKRPSSNPHLPEASTAQCHPAGRHRTRAVDCRHYHRRLRRRAGVCDSGTGPELRPVSSAAGLHRHHGHHGLLRCLPGVHGDRRGSPLRPHRPPREARVVARR
jgi:hypothetical protein